MTLKQKVEFAIEEWMKTKDSRKKKLILLWSEDIPELAEAILKEIRYALCTREEYGDQGCADCGQLVKVPLDFSGWVCCKKCSMKNKIRKEKE